MITVEFKKKSGIYLIQNNKDSRKYIGSATDLYTRYHNHRLHLLRGNHCNQKLQRFVSKYSFEALLFSVIELCDKTDLIKLEQYWIDELKPQFNIAKFAGNTLGYRHTEETKKRLSLAWKTRTTNGMRGRKHTDETKRKIAEKTKARGYNKNFQTASKLANTGRKQTADEIQRRSLTQSKLSIEQIREIHSLKKQGVYQTEIAKKFGVSPRLVVRVLSRIGIYQYLYELDAEYHAAQEARFQRHIQQPNLFISEKRAVEQAGLF